MISRCCFIFTHKALNVQTSAAFAQGGKVARVSVCGAGGLFCGRMHYFNYQEGACEGKVDVRRSQLWGQSILDA